MRKLILVLGVSLLLVTGCSSEEKLGLLKCTKEQDINSDTKLSSTYEVKYKDGNVVKLNTKEVITSSSKDTLEAYKKNLEEIYGAYNNIDYYNNEVKIEGDTLTSTTKVNYEKIDTDKLIEIDKNNEAAIVDGKVKVSTLKEAYEKLGANCTMEKE